MEETSRFRFPERIETERLILRPPYPGDGAEVNAAIRETFEDLKQWMEWADHLPEVEETELRCQSSHARFLSGLDFPVQVRLKPLGVLAASAGLHWRDEKVPSFEIGYWCRASFQRNGYVTEAVKALTIFAFRTMGANRVEIRCDARNMRSRRVAERAGYRLEAELKNERIAPDGFLRNTVLYALVPEEFDLIEAQY